MEGDKIRELLLRCVDMFAGKDDTSEEPIEFAMLFGELFIRLCKYFEVDPFEGAESAKTEN